VRVTLVPTLLESLHFGIFRKRQLEVIIFRASIRAAPRDNASDTPRGDSCGGEGGLHRAVNQGYLSSNSAESSPRAPLGRICPRLPARCLRPFAFHPPPSQLEGQKGELISISRRGRVYPQTSLPPTAGDAGRPLLVVLSPSLSLSFHFVLFLTLP